MPELNTEERIELLEDAQEKLGEVIDLIGQAVNGLSCEGNVEAYLLDHLKIMRSDGHGFVSNDLNIDKVIRMVGKDEEE